MKKLLALFGLLLAGAASAQTQQVINCIAANPPSPCITANQVGNGTQGDPAWLFAGKVNANFNWLWYVLGGALGPTGTGNNVLSNSPVLVTPNLGTPSFVNLQNATALPNSALPSNLQSIANNTVLGNSSGSSAAPSALTQAQIGTILGNLTYGSSPFPVLVVAGTGYAPGDSVTLTGGTSTTAAKVSISTTKAISATVNAGGTGGTNGACTVTGTTGSGTLAQFSGTVSGNSLIGPLTVVLAGSYNSNPISLSAEPVTGCGLSGATVSMVMGALTASMTVAGNYTATPSNPVAQGSTTGSGSGAMFNMTWGPNAPQPSDTVMANCTSGSASPIACHPGPDISLTGSNVWTVTQIEGAGIPLNATALGTNSSGQMVAETTFSLASPPAIGGTTPAAIYATALTSQPIALPTTDAGNVPYTLLQSSVPFILVNGCTVSTTGALSGCTALPVTYANAYMYFPVGTLETTAATKGYAAGFYFVQMTTTQAGQACLDGAPANGSTAAYVSGSPVIPGSCTAPTHALNSTFTTGVALIQAAGINLPAHALGINGEITWEVYQRNDTSAASKTISVTLGSSGVSSVAPTTTAAAAFIAHTKNRGSESVQFSYIIGNTNAASAAQNTGGVVASSVATSSPQTVAFNSTLSSTTSTFAVIESYSITVRPN